MNQLIEMELRKHNNQVAIMWFTEPNHLLNYLRCYSGTCGIHIRMRDYGE